MLDKLDVNIPACCRQTPTLKSLISSAKQIDNEHYKAVFSLEPRLPVILFRTCRFTGADKLIFTCTSKLDRQRIGDVINELFEVDPLTLRVLRIDLAIDIHSFSVNWFKQHAVVARKAVYQEYGKSDAKYLATHWSISNTAQTLEFGRRPNMIRIYDKTAEQINKFEKHLRLKAHRNTSQFKSLSGFDVAEMVTRVERQYGAGNLPKDITVLGDLFQSISVLTPFENIRFVLSNPDLVSNYGSPQHAEAIWFLGEVAKHSSTGVKNMMRAADPKNWGRRWKRYEYLLSTPLLSSAPDLQSLYTASIRNQFGEGEQGPVSAEVIDEIGRLEAA